MPSMKGEPVDNMMGAAQAQQQGQPMDQNDPKVKQTMERAKKYEVVLMQIMHGKKTRDQVIEVLKSNPDPYITVPKAAMTINDMGVQSMKQGGIDVEPGVQLVASQLVLNDLIELGQASEAFMVEEDDIEAILEDTYQAYVERGLKDKSIDPIQLQLEVQQIMDPEMLAGGMAMGAGKVPGVPDQRAVIEQNALMREDAAVKKAQGQQAKKDAVAKRDKMTALASNQMMQEK